MPDGPSPGRDHDAEEPPSISPAVAKAKRLLSRTRRGAALVTFWHDFLSFREWLSWSATGEGRRRDFLEFGSHSYDPPQVLYFGDANADVKVTVGRYCSINPSVSVFIGGEHDPSRVSTFPIHTYFDLPSPPGREQPFSRGSVLIGNDVWIGWDAAIRSGVTVGDGAVIGARSFVISDVAPYTVVAGVPARPIRTRFAPEVVDAMLRIRWWDWPVDEVIAHAEELTSQDLTAFIEAHDPARRG